MLLRRTTMSRKVDAAFGGVTEFTTPGSTTFTVPAGIYEISAVCVGGGGGSKQQKVAGGAGGGLAYLPSIPVIPGESLTVVVGAGGVGASSGTPTAGGESYVSRSGTYLVRASGGAAGTSSLTQPTPGTNLVGLGASGGTSSTGGSEFYGTGGGGAAGYSGNGGIGSNQVVSRQTAGAGGGGGGAENDGSGHGAGGGGVGIQGVGSNGAANVGAGGGGGGGSGGSVGADPVGSAGGYGGNYGGGGGSTFSTGQVGGNGGQGAVAIRWGTNNKFPLPLAYVKGAASGGATSVTLPTHVTGDLIIVFAYRDGNTAQPTLPAGFTAISNAVGANTCSGTLGYKVAASGAETSGTWTNASAIMAVVISGQNASPIGGSGVGGGAVATVTYPTLTMSDAGGNSVVLCFSGHRSVNTTLETPPIGMLRVASFVNATCELACHVTEGGVTAFASRTVLVGGTSSGWRAHSVEIKR